MFNQKVDHIRRSIISILNDDHQIIGYGFFISPHGMAITCYHIISALTTIRIRDYEGNEYEAIIDEYHTRDYVDISDIAILQIPKGTPTFLHVGPSLKDPQELTILREDLEFKDIFYKSGNTFHHPKNLHGLPATITHTTTAVGFISAKAHWPILTSIWQTKKSIQLNLLFQYLSDKYCPGKYDDKEREIKTILNLHLQATAKNLIEKQIILPHYYQEEENYTTTLTAFLESDNHIYFLYGESGSGKTSILINAAATFANDYFTLFLSATDIEPLTSSLPGIIKTFLSNLLTNHPHYTITTDDIMELIYQQPQKCLLIIDGLNKMPRRPTKYFNEWFKRSTRWANGLKLKIVFSSTYSSFNHHTYLTYGFLPKRIHQVHARYDLPNHFKYISRTHHPMLIRFLHDISSKERAAPLDDYPLLSTYLARKCTAIGHLANLPSKTIHNILLDIAKHFTSTGDYWLSPNTYHDMLKEHPQLPALLMQENLFLESINGIRIINEWVADFLIGETLQPDIDWQQFLITSTHTERKGIAWLLAKLSYQGKDVSLLLQNLPSSGKTIPLNVKLFIYSSTPSAIYLIPINTIK